MGEEWLGPPGGAGTELGHDRICTTRKKGKEISRAAEVGGNPGRSWVCGAGEIIHTDAGGTGFLGHGSDSVKKQIHL